MSRVRPLVVTVLAAALLLVGCASTTAPTANKPSAPAGFTADQVYHAVRAAMAAASSVHLTGTIHIDSRDLHVDMRMGPTATVGSLDDGYPASHVEVRTVSGVTYLQLNQDEVNSLTQGTIDPSKGPAAVGKWVPSTCALGRQLYVSNDANWYDYQQFQRNILDGLMVGKLSPAGSSTVDGVSVLTFNTDSGGQVDVAAASPHYLVRSIGSSLQPGTLDFTDWNTPVNVTAPTTDQQFTN